MSKQTQVKLQLPLTCLCGKQPKLYCTDYIRFHLECYPCQIVTPKYYNLTNAVSAFRFLTKTLTTDKQQDPNLAVISNGKN